MASIRGGLPGVPSGQLLCLDFSFEIGNGGSRVAGEGLPFCSFFCQGVCSFIFPDIHVTWDPMYMSLDSSGGKDFGVSVGFEDVFLPWMGALVSHSAYCRLVVAEDPYISQTFFFFFILFFYSYCIQA